MEASGSDSEGSGSGSDDEAGTDAGSTPSLSAPSSMEELEMQVFTQVQEWRRKAAALDM